MRATAEQFRELNRQLYLLHTFCEALQKTMDRDDIVHVSLTTLTAGGALGFSRAAFFFLKDNATFGDGRGIGPLDEAEASLIWTELSSREPSLAQLYSREHRLLVEQKPFSIKARSLSWRYADIPGQSPLHTILHEHRVLHLSNNHEGLPPGLRDLFKDGPDIILAPALAENNVTGIIVADNAFHRKPIEQGTLDFIALVSLQTGSALRNAAALRQTRQTLDEVRDLNRRLQETHEELLQYERLAAIGRISGFLAHEIRNPLVTVGGFARQLLESDDRPKTLRNARIIVNEIEKLELSLNNLLGFSSFPRPRKSVWRPADLMRELEEFFSLDAEKNGVTLRTAVPASLELFADRFQMELVLRNLIANAMEATPKNGIIRVEGKTDEAMVVITIEDTGYGIKTENITKVFDPFFTTKSHGIGLGLFFALAIVEKNHGGTLAIISEIGTGTRVTIRLPGKEIS